jgi:hypothetical protein
MTDRELLVAMLDVVNDTDVLPVTAKQDYLGDAAPAASVQLLAGTRWTVRYIDGSGEGQIPFAVNLRVDDADSSGRTDASSTLMELATALEDTPLDDPMVSISGEMTPMLVARENGTAVWRAQYMLNLVRRAGESPVS